MFKDEYQCYSNSRFGLGYGSLLFKDSNPLPLSTYSQCTVTGYERQRSLKNMSAEEVGQIFQLLRDTLGRRVPAHNEFGTGVVEKTGVSVQGVWRNRPEFALPETNEMLELRKRRHRDYSVERVVDEFGLEGFVRMTQKLLEQREKVHLAALAEMPKKERVMPTE